MSSVEAPVRKAELERQLENINIQVASATKELESAKRMTNKAFKSLDKIDTPGKRDTQKFHDLRGTWVAAENLEEKKFNNLFNTITRQKILMKRIEEAPDDKPVNLFIKKAAKSNLAIRKLLAQGKIG